MRLGVKIFFATSLVIVLMVAAAGWTLLVVRRLGANQQTLVARAVPALQQEGALRLSVETLTRLESRYILLGDPVYAKLWRTRADRTAEDLAAIAPHLDSPEERRAHRKVATALTLHRRHAAREDTGPSVGPRPTLVDVRMRGARLERAVDMLEMATATALDRGGAQTRQLEEEAWHTVGIAAVLSLFVAFLAAALLAHRMTRSLRRLADAADQVAHGSFPERLDIRSRDEIGQLGRAFVQMTERLREIDRLKQELFAHISHELRTPLTSVREAGGLLRDEVPGPLNAKQLRLVDIIRLNTERMLTLVNQILELARLRGGMLALERRRVDVDALVGRALEALRPQAEANGVTLAREDGTASAGTVVGDEERLFQVVLNLVANAIKFTPPGGAVRVCVGPRADGVDIAVEDTGRGIPTAAVGHVFERYWQARPESGGTGLGLAIVKGVVDAHGGEVRVESVEGRGSCFTVHLPREMRAA